MSAVNDKKLIYLLDDDQNCLDLLKRIITRFDIDVEFFLAPDIFLARVKEKKPDLCFIDLNFGPALGAGFQVIKAIKKMIIAPPILIVNSTRDTSEDIENALSFGADDYLIKPISSKIIENKLRQHLKYIPEVLGSTFTLVDEKLKKCKIDLNSHLYSVSEFGFIILTPHFVPKDTLIEFGTGMLFEIANQRFSMRVNNIWIHAESGLYGISFLFTDEVSELKMIFRKWILEEQLKSKKSILKT